MFLNLISDVAERSKSQRPAERTEWVIACNRYIHTWEFLFYRAFVHPWVKKPFCNEIMKDEQKHYGKNINKLKLGFQIWSI